jgi:hypothetical protein
MYLLQYGLDRLGHLLLQSLAQVESGSCKSSALLLSPLSLLSLALALILSLTFLGLGLILTLVV